ncbi:MAG: ABC transporter ATP-binding protein [Pseudomonadota bacterium]
MLEVRHIEVAYGEVVAVWGVSIEVGEGELVAIVGPNGAGKTSLLNALSGLIGARAGSIKFLGRDLAAVPAHQRALLGLCQCPEGRKLFPEMTVEENLRLGAYRSSGRDEVAARLDRVFAMFPKLAERRRQVANTLSGGEQQMTALGRALMAAPKLLLLDEPSLGLAPIVVAEMFRYIRDIHRAGVTVLIVEQNVLQTLELADRAYVIENGRIALAGPARRLLDDPHIRHAYLGLG